MKNAKLILILSLFVILMTVFGNVCAQDPNLPAFKVSQAVTDEKVVLTTKNFPADMNYTVSMASQDDPEKFTPVAKFNSKNGGSLNVTVKIPEKFHGLNTIILRVQDANGSKMIGSFVNVPEEQPVEEEPITLQNQEPAAEEPAAEEPAQEPAAEEPAEEETITLQNQEPAAEEPAAEEPAQEPAAAEPAEEETITLQNQEPAAEEPAAEEPAQEPAAEEPAAEEPVQGGLEEPAPAQEIVEEIQPVENGAPVQEMICDYTLTPTVHIDAVTRNKTVTFTTKDFPADKTFSVQMGVYVESWRPAPIPWGRPVVVKPIPFKPYTPPSFPDYDAPAAPSAPAVPGPKFERTVSFNGTEAGTFNSGTGEPQTLTFEIPANLQGLGIIALWVRDLSPCGFYSYNWFYNNTTNW